MSIESKLEQVNKDIEALQENKREIEKQIKDSEVTYSIGDRFKQSGGGSKCILSRWDGESVGLTMLEDGGRWTSPFTVKDVKRITIKELDRIFCGDRGRFVRYYDCRKGESC